MRTLPVFTLLGLAVVLLEAPTPVAPGRRVVCISAGNDAFLSGCEGYYRQRAAKGGVAGIIQVGGSLNDCLARVRKGDTLVVVAHGGPGYFNWSTAKGETTSYDGYGAGTGAGDNPHPLPPNLAGTNHVTATQVSCHSDRDPDGTGEQIPVTESLRRGLGEGNPVDGFDRVVNSQIGYDVRGAANAQQRQQAMANLAAKSGWMRSPPVNRNPVPNPNHQTAAQDTLRSKQQFMNKNLTVNISYLPPLQKATLLGAAPEAIPETCGGAVAVPLPEGATGVPGLPAGGALLVAYGLLAAGAAMVRRRARPA